MEGSECEAKDSCILLEGAAEGKDGLIPRMERFIALCLLGCKSNPIISGENNLWRKLK